MKKAEIKVGDEVIVNNDAYIHYNKIGVVIEIDKKANLGYFIVFNDENQIYEYSLDNISKVKKIEDDIEELLRYIGRRLANNTIDYLYFRDKLNDVLETRIEGIQYTGLSHICELIINDLFNIGK